HDTALWDNCDLNLEINQFFSPGQYLIADSGFPAEKKFALSLPVCVTSTVSVFSRVAFNLYKWIGACVVLHDFPLNGDSSNQS
ncbi:hypothetical protein VP01_8908g1, partial [Puccinia sorghi]